MKISSVKTILRQKKIIFFESKCKDPRETSHEIAPEDVKEIYNSFIFKTGTDLNQAVDHVLKLINFMKSVGPFVSPLKAKGDMTDHIFIPHGALIYYKCIKYQFMQTGFSMRFLQNNTLRENISLTLFRYTYTELNSIIIRIPLLMNLLNLSPMFSSSPEIERVVKQYFKSPSRYALIRRHSSKK